jgi:hypothetical protein
MMEVGQDCFPMALVVGLGWWLRIVVFAQEQP